MAKEEDCEESFQSLQVVAPEDRFGLSEQLNSSVSALDPCQSEQNHKQGNSDSRLTSFDATQNQLERERAN